VIGIKFKKRQALKRKKRLRNKARIRKRIYGSSDVPRLCVFKSTKHIYAQLIDDTKELTLYSESSLRLKASGKPVDIAHQVGQELAQKALEKKIKSVVFDRSGFIYHGRVKALADGAREGGLKF